MEAWEFLDALPVMTEREELADIRKRLEEALGELRQIQVDMDSYNENYNMGAPIVVPELEGDIREVEVFIAAVKGAQAKLEGKG